MDRVKIMAEFKFMGFLSEMFGEKEMKISLERPRTLKDIFEVEFPEDRSVVYINQRIGTFDSLIRNKDKVIIMPMVSGG